MKPSAHLHLLINAAIVDPPGPQDLKKIDDFMTGLVKHVRMKVMLPPVSAWCDDLGNEGITSTVILTTSHCAMHIWNFPEPNLSMMQFDLYSCAPFTVDEVLEYISMNFKVVKASYKFLDRESDLVDVDAGKVMFVK